jgi:hypothetical protein
MRRLIALVVPFLVALPVLAQEPPANPPATNPPAASGPTLRVSLDLASQVDGEAEPVNGLQYFVFERLANFGLRVDSRRPAGQERFDTWMNKKVARWEEQAPDAAPATLAISGSSGCTYDNAPFFGQAQAHNFKGRVNVELKDAAGATVAAIAFDHSWGRLPSKFTRSQTLQEYHQMVSTAVVLALLSRPEIQAGVPEGKKGELATYITEQKEKLLKPLRENMAECELAKLVEGLPSGPRAGCAAEDAEALKCRQRLCFRSGVGCRTLRD